MKNLILLVAICASTSCFAQKIGGFYSGTLQNDTNRMIQNYELAIGEYRGKVSGYAYVTFVSNDTFYYGVRKVKGEIVNDQLIVSDGEMLANNFPKSPAKGVKRTFTIPLNGQDSITSLNGKWQTNRTKSYYSIPGRVEMKKSSDSSHSALFSHLKELNIISDYKVQAGDPETARSSKTSASTKTTITTKPEPVIVKSVSWEQRSKANPQTVNVESDSLTLSFYDNGVVDGDSISVYLNGQNIISNTRLTTVASKRMISIKNLSDVELILVAENLGTIPPNTGLVTIKDGEKLYQLNFSADLQTNASIILRRTSAKK